MSLEQIALLPEPTRRTVGRRTIGPEEEQRAILILEDWNRQTGQRWRPLTGSGELSYFAKMIAGRVLQEPSMSIADFSEVIRRNLAAPWWRGRGKPAVVFSPKVWELARACDGARAESESEGDADLAAMRSLLA